MHEQRRFAPEKRSWNGQWKKKQTKKTKKKNCKGGRNGGAGSKTRAEAETSGNPTILRASNYSTLSIYEHLFIKSISTNYCSKKTYHDTERLLQLQNNNLTWEFC